MDAAGYFMEGVLRMTSILAGDNQLRAGRVFDEALTYFLSSYKAELGDQLVVGAAARLIWNIALFLGEAERNAVHNLLIPIIGRK